MFNVALLTYSDLPCPATRPEPSQPLPTSIQTVGLGGGLKDFVLRLSPQRSTGPITIESRPTGSLRRSPLAQSEICRLSIAPKLNRHFLHVRNSEAHML